MFLQTTYHRNFHSGVLEQSVMSLYLCWAGLRNTPFEGFWYFHMPYNCLHHQTYLRSTFPKFLILVLRRNLELTGVFNFLIRLLCRIQFLDDPVNCFLFPFCLIYDPIAPCPETVLGAYPAFCRTSLFLWNSHLFICILFYFNWSFVLVTSTRPVTRVTQDDDSVSYSLSHPVPSFYSSPVCCWL
jgi:hypothetical protein